MLWGGIIYENLILIDHILLVAISCSNLHALERSDTMHSIGVIEILAILLIALLLFGAKKLPDIGRAIGQAYRELKKGLHTDPATEESANHDQDKNSSNK